MPHFTPPTSLLETLQSLRYEDALSADDPRYVDTREARGSQQTLNRLAKKLGCDQTWQIWLEDPDGNSFEVHQYTPESAQFMGGSVEADW